ncbi:hypothetical protein V5O48_014149 [Marasmius crinis-equi]|uniref:Uncharacterized protein n=1 Tax=Marasmius crinis-equi TaxID=585013 RepID=A0ABR3EY36_9AGAR
MPWLTIVLQHQQLQQQQSINDTDNPYPYGNYTNEEIPMFLSSLTDVTTASPLPYIAPLPSPLPRPSSRQADPPQLDTRDHRHAQTLPVLPLKDNQVNQLRPKIVEQFLSEPDRMGTGRFIAAGPCTSAVVDKQGVFFMAGKVRFRFLGSKRAKDLPARHIQHSVTWLTSLGGVTHWISTPSESDLDPYSHPTAPRMIVSWGQNPVNSELGLGVDEPKSCTKPQRHEKLDGLGCGVIGVAGAAHTTLFLVKPNPPASSSNPPPAKEKKDDEDDKDKDKFSNLPRRPEELPNTPDACVACKKDSGDPLECDKCDNPYHLSLK